MSKAGIDSSYAATRAQMNLTLAQLGMTQSSAERLMAQLRGDEKKAAEAEKNHAGFAAIQAKLRADERGHNLGYGDTIKLRASDTTGTVNGWASTSGMDLYRHKVMGGAFSQAIAKRGLSGPKSIKLLLDHDWQKPAGVITTLEYRGDNLWIDAQLDLNVSYVKDRYSVMQLAGGFNFSVGFILEDYSFKKDANDLEYMEITRGDLFEVSIVLFPGNEEATMASVKSSPTATGFDAIEAKLASMQDKLATLMRTKNV